MWLNYHGFQTHTEVVQDHGKCLDDPGTGRASLQAGRTEPEAPASPGRSGQQIGHGRDRPRPPEPGGARDDDLRRPAAPAVADGLRGHRPQQGPPGLRHQQGHRKHRDAGTPTPGEGRRQVPGWRVPPRHPGRGKRHRLLPGRDGRHLGRGHLPRPVHPRDAGGRRQGHGASVRLTNEPGFYPN